MVTLLLFSEICTPACIKLKVVISNPHGNSINVNYTGGIALQRSRIVLTSKCMRCNSFQEILHFRIHLSSLTTSVPKFFKVHVSSAVSAVGCILHVERDPS